MLPSAKMETAEGGRRFKVDEFSAEQVKLEMMVMSRRKLNTGLCFQEK